MTGVLLSSDQITQVTRISITLKSFCDQGKKMEP